VNRFLEQSLAEQRIIALEAAARLWFPPHSSSTRRNVSALHFVQAFSFRSDDTGMLEDEILLAQFRCVGHHHCPPQIFPVRAQNHSLSRPILESAHPR